MKKIKDKIYNCLVRKNEHIQYEYERYVQEHIEDHNKKRIRHWIILLKLNWHYRVKKRHDPIVFTDIHNDKPKEQAPVSKYLPYLKGAESRSRRYTSPADMVKTLNKYDVISFDVFDTLIFRPFSKPQDLFFIIGGELDLLNFYNIRIDAEKNLRERRSTAGIPYEITLFDIYKEINYYNGLDIQLGMETEIRNELKYCYANPYMQYVFNALKANGKRIVLTTDIYLPYDVLERILKKCNFIGYEKLFVSCEYGCTKKDGQLFDIVINYVGKDKQIIHVGDNERSDVKEAQNKGINSILYENINSVGNPYRAIDMSPMISSVYRGIVNAHLHNGFQRYDAYHEFGYIYGGLFVLGYCNFIHELALQKKADKILFVARDGYLIKQIYESLYSDISTDYVFWSRIVGLKLCAYKYKNDYMKEYVYRWVKENKRITFRELLSNMSLTSLIQDFTDHANLLLDECITAENQTKFEAFINYKWNTILAIYEKDFEAAKKYFLDVVEDSQEICVVDIGWRGQGALAIRSLMKEKWRFSCNVYGTVAASAPTKTNSQQLALGIINSYMFSPLQNIDCFKFHSKNAINNVLTEILVGAPHPSLKSIQNVNGDYEFVFDVPEISNYQVMGKIHQGVKEFVEDYKRHFDEDKYLFHISGNDAYMPIKHIFKDYSFMKSFFGRYEFQDFVGGTMGYRSRTIQNIFKKFNL